MTKGSEFDSIFKDFLELCQRESPFFKDSKIFQRFSRVVPVRVTLGGGSRPPRKDLYRSPLLLRAAFQHSYIENTSSFK